MSISLRQYLPQLKFLRRARQESGPVTLRQRRIYILPTREGLLLGGVLIAILLGAINYANSLAFALVFLLCGLGAIAMLHTWRNLLGLRVEVGHSTAVFAGETARFSLGLFNPDTTPRQAIILTSKQGARKDVDLMPGIQWLELDRPAVRRGRLSMGRLTIASRFPLGLFRAWSPLHLQMECMVYPKPAPSVGLPTGLAADAGRGGQHGLGQDDFAALRTYHPGDSLRHVHWKAVARGQGMYTKQFTGEAAEELWLAWELLPGLATEARLSQLCRWVLDADADGLVYGLRLPDISLQPDHGSHHRRRCLEALALYGEHR